MKVDFRQVVPKPLFGHRVLVTGGRDFKDRFLVWDVLDEIRRAFDSFECLIHGNARGVDTFARDWAVATNTKIESFPVTREEWQRLGWIAGHKRNERMFKKGKPTLGVAFPGGGGTANMTGIMKNKIPVIVADEEGNWKIT